MYDDNLTANQLTYLKNLSDQRASFLGLNIEIPPEELNLLEAQGYIKQEMLGDIQITEKGRQRINYAK